MTSIIPNLKLFLFLSFLALLVLLFDSLTLLNFPKKVVSYITNPVSFGIYNTNQKIGRQFHFIFAARNSAQENKVLRETLGKLFSENAELRKKLAESQAQISQEKHLSSLLFNLLPVRPVGLGRYLKIDKGSSAGIKEGQVVVFESNYIGKIKNVSPESANIELLTDPDSKVSAFSLNTEGRAKGILTGQFGTELLLDKILHEEKTESGDLVYSEGLEGFLPRGLILGKIIEVFQRENEIFKQAKVVPVFDIRDLDLVFVILD